jgi:hypothetical protein
VTDLLPLAVAVGVLAAPAYAGAAGAPPVVPIHIHDACDPATFNAMFGPGTCVGGGDVTFARFLSVLTSQHLVPQWRFAPDEVQMTVGQSFKATNVGGELHSFTEVKAFGGGVFPLLNDLSNSGPTRPECAAAFADFQAGKSNTSFVGPGQSFTDTEGLNDVGHPVLYMCCIHPWMHETITVLPGT